MLSSRPYLLRAVNEWIVDSGMTPHLLVDGEATGLEVPDSARQEGKVILNISPTAVRDLIMDNELVTFVARFGGVSRAVSVPVNAVQAVYARENGRGMMFPEEEDLDSPGSSESGPGDDNGDTGGDDDRRPRPNLRVVK
jgi:stringent starvation protein B